MCQVSLSARYLFIMKSSKKRAATSKKTGHRRAATTSSTKAKAWAIYEKVATDLINQFRKEFGPESVEKKQKIQGHDTSWEIDAKGVLEGDKGFLVVECRRYPRKKQSQAQLGSLAYSIIDTGAVGGIIVSPLDLQEGANKIAASRNIVSVRLDAESTTEEYVIQFLDKLFLGIGGKVKTSATAHPRYFAVCAKCGEKFEVFGDSVARSEHVCDDCAAG
jgi:hypothetical protein